MPATKTETEPLPTDFLTPKEVHQRFRVSTDAVYQACRNGYLRHYRLPARAGCKGRLLIREADLREWFQRGLREVDCVYDEEPAPKRR